MTRDEQIAQFLTREETVVGLRLDLHEDEAEGRQGRVERLRAAIHYLTARPSPICKHNWNLHRVICPHGCRLDGKGK